MEHLNRLSAILDPLPTTAQPILVLLLLPALIITFTYLYTTTRYRLSLHSHLSPPTDSESKPLLPPTIPYSIPILGSALSFLAPYPGQFWRRLFTTHPKETGVCTLQLGGQRTHVLFDHTAITALFKARGLNRDRFNVQLSLNGLGAGSEDTRRFWGEGGGRREARESQEGIVQRYLLRTERVGELVGNFASQFRVAVQGREGEDGEEIVGIASWVKKAMFVASVKALMGERLFEIYPEIVDDWEGYDEAIMSLFCGIPKFIIPEKYAARTSLLHGLSQFQRHAREECKGNIASPEDVNWEPLFGSRYNRARQICYEEVGLSIHGKAAMDGGTLFGLASNPPPAVGWALAHIFDPRENSTLYPRLME